MTCGVEDVETPWIILNFVSYVLLIIPVLINVAFITLLERKILGYSQLRKGPNKVGFAGVPQPFNDAIKLFTKELTTPYSSNGLLFLLAPTLAIIFRLLVWSRVPIVGSASISISFIFIYMILSINIYPLMISGWSSNRNYASIGALRGIAQTISYEIRFALLILFFTLGGLTFSITSLTELNLIYNKVLLFPPLMGLWLISCLAETNRTPFDFAEGESELVSGFNVEYGRVGFALLFIAEYARIFFMSVLVRILFLSRKPLDIIRSFLATSFIFFWVWTRTTLPRYRYDILIGLAWFSILPSRLLTIFYAVALSI